MDQDYLPPKRSWETEVKEGQKQGESFENEEIDSLTTYPVGHKIKSIQEQLALLKRYFPSLKVETQIPLQLPEIAEGWIVVPKFFRIATDYNEALRMAMDLLQRERPYLLNWRKGELGKGYLRLTNRTQRSLNKINEIAQGDYAVIPSQLGLRHIGRSARRTYALFKPNEFGLGPFEITIFLLIHPEWLSTPDDIGIDCVGCEYTLYRHGYFKYILFFYFFENNLRFGDRWCGCPDKKFGPATGFFP